MALIDLQCEGVRFPFGTLRKKRLHHLLVAAIERLSLTDVSLTVIFTDDRYIRKINRKFRGKDRATDVISFCNREMPFPSGDETNEDLGEIYVSLERARIQAEEFGETLEREVARLLVHGLLHLLGYDHEGSKRRLIEMELKEEDLLASLSPRRPEH
ncbi:MAG: rRNA maturation RNase YbeY [Spirochaetes bacterium]|nr:rRNA maturation RNase YbeY [Spirochaetota bacterium]